MWMAFLLPSGRQRGTKKQVEPRENAGPPQVFPSPSGGGPDVVRPWGPVESVLASTRWPSHMGAEKNHLWPVMRNSSPQGPLP